MYSRGARRQALWYNILLSEAHIGPPRGEKFSGPEMEIDHFCTKKSTQQQSRYSRDRHHYQPVSVSASEQANKGNKH